MRDAYFSVLRQLTIVVALSVLLTACSSTQRIEESPPELLDEAKGADQPQPEQAGDQQALPSDSAALNATPYSQDVAGTVSELYGEQAEVLLSDSYRQAVDVNLKLALQHCLF